jgi:DNA-directed RNA polymerase specialized sigma24 family protein
MRAVIAGTKRETLLQEIHGVFLQWPELERRIFSQAHYNGQSPEAISRSLQLDVKEVSTILKQCERRLYASLSNFRISSCEKPSLAPSGIARPAA